MQVGSMENRRNCKKWMNDFPGGVLLISRDEEEKILAVNEEVLRIFECPGEKEFMNLSGSRFRGLIAEEEYRSLEEIFSSHNEKGRYNFYNFSSISLRGRTLDVEGVLGRAEDDEFGPVWVLGLVRSEVRHRALEQEMDTGLIGKYDFRREAFRLKQEDMAQGVYGKRIVIFINLVRFSFINANYGVGVGNAVLKRMGQILRRHFPADPVAHVASDDFIILAGPEHALEKLDAAVEEINDIMEDDSVRCKAGAVRFGEGYISVAALKRMTWWEPFDLARKAAESIKNDGSRNWVLYTPALGQKLINTAFVMKNFKRALREGHIQVFYQPVIRALTGKLCSFEALARWTDPEKGMILPSVFIPVLEKMNLIHLLDCYVIEETAKLYAKLMREGWPVVPVSVNLSRMDFDAMDPFAFLEHIVSTYQVPRRLFRIEVTESALTLNGEALKKELSRFRKAGYQLWLDDFGSGYSSLNVLKEFHFDELKIDMAFLQNFNEDSRKIIRSIILMAKNLSIHTLAEGAETKEQVEFLKESGCEKIQGFFYGRPMSWEEAREKIIAAAYVPETAVEEAVMDDLGDVNVITEKPMGLFLHQKGLCRLILRNEALARETRSVSGTDGALFTGGELHGGSPSYDFIHALIEESWRSGRMQSAIIVRNGNLLKYEVHTLKGGDTLAGGALSVMNVTLRKATAEKQDMDGLYMNMMHVFTGMYYYRQKEKKVEVLLTTLPGMKSGDVLSVEQVLQVKSLVHPDDRKRFLAFLNEEHVLKAADRSPYSAAGEVFRFKDRNGRYEWKEIVAVKAEHNGAKDVLVGAKPMVVTPHSEEERKRLLAQYIASFRMSRLDEGEFSRNTCFLYALCRMGTLKFFWKDRDRRFLGASSAFLSYYGFSDEKTILGKTDEDMGWHLGDSSYREEEEKVLHRGVISEKVRGQCIARGRVRTISATKVPVYQGNEIIGLLGWFIDLGDEEQEKEQNVRRFYMDEESGFLSYRGIMISAQHYDDAFHTSGADYEAILLKIPGIESFGREYGKTGRRLLIQAVGDAIRNTFASTSVIGREGIDSFLIFRNGEEERALKKKLDKLAEALGHIHSAGGYPCTLFLGWALVRGREVKNLDDIRSLLIRRTAYYKK